MVWTISIGEPGKAISCSRMVLKAALTNHTTKKDKSGQDGHYDRPSEETKQNITKHLCPSKRNPPTFLFVSGRTDGEYIDNINQKEGRTTTWANTNRISRVYKSRISYIRLNKQLKASKQTSSHMKTGQTMDE